MIPPVSRARRSAQRLSASTAKTKGWEEYTILALFTEQRTLFLYNLPSALKPRRHFPPCKLSINPAIYTPAYPLPSSPLTHPHPLLHLLLLIPLLRTHRPPQNHQPHNLKQRIRRRHRRQLGIRIVRRRHLHDIRRDYINRIRFFVQLGGIVGGIGIGGVRVGETADDFAEFTRGPAAGFGGAGRRGDCGFWVRKRGGGGVWWGVLGLFGGFWVWGGEEGK